MVTHIEPQLGTDEWQWAGWTGPAGWPALDLSALALGRPVVVLAAHPDDEVLGAGGLVHLLAEHGARLRFVWATSGERSHPGSSARAADALAADRRAESAAALAVLGVGHAPRTWLGLPDGALAEQETGLVRLLGSVIDPRETVLAPYRDDGHPDHEVCGRAAHKVAGTVLEYPVWAWHWAHPGDERVPWRRAWRVDLPPATRAAKAAAVERFATQVRPIGPRPEDGPVLPPRVLAHFARDYEVVLT